MLLIKVHSRTCTPLIVAQSHKSGSIQHIKHLGLVLGKALATVEVGLPVASLICSYNDVSFARPTWPGTW